MKTGTGAGESRSRSWSHSHQEPQKILRWRKSASAASREDAITDDANVAMNIADIKAAKRPSAMVMVLSFVPRPPLASARIVPFTAEPTDLFGSDHAPSRSGPSHADVSGAFPNMVNNVSIVSFGETPTVRIAPGETSPAARSHR